MQLQVSWSAEVKKRFPDLMVCIGIINDVRPERHNDKVEGLKRALYEEVRAKHSIETLKDNATVRAYRDFYWKLDIDPTKTRPSGEALLRRVLNGNDLPNISTIVDAYNLVSMKTMIPMSGFDRDHLKPPLQVRFANNDEAFIGIGMNKPMSLLEKMLVVADQKQVLCIYPYRDSDSTKIAMQTKNAVIIGYGALGIPEGHLKKAVETTLSYIKQVSGGDTEAITVF